MEQIEERENYTPSIIFLIKMLTGLILLHWISLHKNVKHKKDNNNNNYYYYLINLTS